MYFDGHDTSRVLDRTLADLIHLELLARHIAWNLQGPMVGSLYAAIDNVAIAAQRAAGEVARRSATLGHPPDGRPEVTMQSALGTVDAGPVRDVHAVELVGTLVDTVVTRVHQAIDVVFEDPVTVRVLTDVAGDLEELSWKVRSHVT